jgi:uncharacterized membrane protein YhfC
MQLFWMIVAAVAIVVAAIFLLRREFNTAFVVAVIGAVAWFLNYRGQMQAVKARIDREREANAIEDEEEDEK